MLSTTSASSHPLRQTSFPPENSNAETPRFSRSPSVDTMSLVSGVSAPKRKRGTYRKSKGKADSESVVGGTAKSAVSGTSGRGAGKGKKIKSRGESVDPEEEEEGGDGLALETVARTQEEKQKEVQQRAMLTEQFDEDQWLRYGAWRSAKLSESVVRRIVNQTLSQSAPGKVIFGLQGIAKVYAGNLIEGARKVQAQWDEVDEEAKANLPTPPPDGEEKRRGPLLPEHLVEAYRRHRLAREGGSAGQLPLFQLQERSTGVERFGAKVGGKILFK